MTTLLTRMFRDRCSNCQVEQGRHCQCRKRRARREMTSGEWWFVILVVLACFWLAVIVAVRASA